MLIHDNVQGTPALGNGVIQGNQLGHGSHELRMLRLDTNLVDDSDSLGFVDKRLVGLVMGWRKLFATKHLCQLAQTKARKG